MAPRCCSPCSASSAAADWAKLGQEKAKSAKVRQASRRYVGLDLRRMLQGHGGRQGLCWSWRKATQWLLATTAFPRSEFGPKRPIQQGAHFLGAKGGQVNMICPSQCGRGLNPCGHAAQSPHDLEQVPMCGTLIDRHRFECVPYRIQLRIGGPFKARFLRHVRRADHQDGRMGSERLEQLNLATKPAGVTLCGGRVFAVRDSVASKLQHDEVGVDLLELLGKSGAMELSEQGA